MPTATDTLVYEYTDELDYSSLSPPQGNSAEVGRELVSIIIMHPLGFHVESFFSIGNGKHTRKIQFLLLWSLVAIVILEKSLCFWTH